MDIDDAIFKKFFDGITAAASLTLITTVEQHLSECQGSESSFSVCDCGRTLVITCRACGTVLAITGSDTQPCEHALAMRAKLSADHRIIDASY